MDLAGIRTKFIENSGRYDLATPVGTWTTDNGADFYINAGIRFLDLKQEQSQTSQVWIETVAAGDADITLTGLRALREVWLTDSDGVNFELKKVDMEFILTDYPKLTAEDSGTPAHWAVNVGFQALGGDAGGIAEGVHELLIMPPPDTAYTLRAYGDFKALELSNNTDVNWWTVSYPDLVVLAALMRLEGFYRNTQGYRDYREQLEEILIGIDHDLANESMPENEDLFLRG